MSGFGLSKGFPWDVVEPPDALRRNSVWAKGRTIFSYDPSEWRMDVYGSIMRYSEYGQISEHGWEQDHMDPDGPDELWNLQPLYWLNNRRKSDKSSIPFPGLAGLLGSGFGFGGK
jgi:hypothetical protein